MGRKKKKALGIDTSNHSQEFIARCRKIWMNRCEREANAARIAACVNACAGMDDPAAEIAHLRAELQHTKCLLESERACRQGDMAVVEALRETVAELVAACDDARSMLDGLLLESGEYYESGEHYDAINAEIEDLDESIAKARGVMK
jgi:hypothetical protein